VGTIRFTKQEQDAILSQSRQFWERSTESMRSFLALTNENERMARLLLPSDLEAVYQEYEDRSSLVPPDNYNNINSHRANFRKALFAKKPYHRVYIAGMPGVRNEPVIKAEHVLQGTYDRAGGGTGFPAEADKVHYQALYNGLSCCFTKWTQEFHRTAVRNEQTGEPVLDDNGDFQFEYKLISEYPETIFVDIRRVRIPQTVVEWRDRRMVGVQSLAQYSELLEKKRNEASAYEFDENALKNSTFQRDKYFEYVKDESDKVSEKGSDQEQFTDKPIEVWSIRGLYRFIQPDGSWRFRDLIVEIGNQSILMAAKANDLPIEGWNLFEFPRIDVQGERLFPMGLMEAGRDLFVEGFIKRNQSLDATNRGIYTNYIGDSGACANLPKYIENNNDQLLLLDMGASNLTNVGAALQPLVRPNIGVDPFQHSQFLSRELQQTHRLSDYMQGVNPESSETATGVMNLVAGGANLTDFMVEQLADTFYRPVARKHLILWNFFNGYKQNSVYGPDGRKYDIGPGEIDLPFNVVVEVKTGQTNQAQVRRFVETLPLLMNNPYLDQRVLIETLIELEELPNSERLIPPDDYLKIQIDRENLALGSGVEQPVHPMDNHGLHIEGHTEYLDYVSQSQDQAMASAAGIRTDMVEAHIMEHQQFMEQMSGSLGNTKELGGNAGNLGNAQSASMKGSAGGKTGAYLAREGRA
jgi:hypothetical protein